MVKLDIIPFCPKNGSILEVGSCTGGMTFLLNYNYPELKITSIDNNKEFIDFLVVYNNDKIFFKYDDIFSHNKVYDYVITEQTIIGKILPYENVIKKISELSKKGAIFAEIKKDNIKEMIKLRNKLTKKFEDEIENGFIEYESLIRKYFQDVKIHEKKYYRIFVAHH